MPSIVTLVQTPHEPSPIITLALMQVYRMDAGRPHGNYGQYKYDIRS